ncbi:MULTISPECIES: hypothetical protein [Streptomyces]|uniref:hypothetical protein n=1 Tax=Streptomyces TaxID=1883 RepID=UPI001C2EFDD6|nr:MULTISPECIES: hypothetical protein [unclassified Streptomyces]MBV1955655.1 hypothetical protein [Streptomyces sp. BV333]MCG5120295.1 hypothetical protein [Streptomyces sp. T7(2022)]
MNTGVRIGLYAAGLAVAFGAAYGAGDRFGPASAPPTPVEHSEHREGGAGEEHGQDHDAPPAT